MTRASHVRRFGVNIRHYVEQQHQLIVEGHDPTYAMARLLSLTRDESANDLAALATVLARAVEDGDDTTLREIGSVLSDLAIEVELINSAEEHLGPLRADSVTR
jgi:hypothetical protein